MMAGLQWTVCILFFCTAVQAELSITGCGGSGVSRFAEVDQTAEQHTFTCTGIRSSHTVMWKLNYSPLGECPRPTSIGKDSCHNVAVGGLTPHRAFLTTSTLTVSGRRLLENATFFCEEITNPGSTVISSANCSVDLITPAQGTCRADFITSLQPWYVHVHCDVTSGNSSRRNYFCRIFQDNAGAGGRTVLKDWSELTSNNLPSRTAVCAARLDFKDIPSGPQRYTVQLTPGHQNVTVQFRGENEKSQPQSPSIDTCSPEDFVPENSNLTCLCKTDSLGLPPGVLRWSGGFNDNFNTDNPLELGKAGQTQLRLTTTLKRQDHDAARFRCDVVWSYDVTGDVKTASVGYPASRVTFGISPHHTVSEDTKVTFSCSASDGLPSPSLTLRSEGGAQMAEQTLSLTHRSVVRCENSGEYTCTASNGMGPDHIESARLAVTCAPRDLHGDIPSVNYEQGEEAGFAFEVVSNPPPSLTFVFLGSSKTNAPSAVKDLSLSGQCQTKKGVTYISRCSVTIANMTSWGAAGLYNASVGNSEGSLSFVFEVKVNATALDPPSSLGTIVGAAVGGLAVLVVILVVVFIIIRRRKKDALLNQGSDKPIAHGGVVKYSAALNGTEREEPPVVARHSTRFSPTAEQPLLAASDGESETPDDDYVNVRKASHDMRQTEGSGQQPNEVYAVVQKKTGGTSGQHGPDPNSPQSDNLYAVVDKKKAGQRRAPTSAEPPCQVNDSQHSLEEKEFVEAPVYGNIDVQGDMGHRPQKPDCVTPEDSDGGDPNLLYVSVDFSDRPAGAAPSQPARQEEGVVYSAIDFNRTAPTE